MGVLGVPYRIAYEAIRARSGLTDVQAFLVDPNGNTLGPFAMPELIANSGIYTYTFNTTITSPAGEYIVIIISPTEMIKSYSRASLYPSVDITGLQNFLSSLVSPSLKGFVRADNQIVGVIKGETMINANIENDSTIFGIAQQDERLSAVIKSDSTVRANVGENSQINAKVQNESNVLGVLQGDLLI